MERVGPARDLLLRSPGGMAAHHRCTKAAAALACLWGLAGVLNIAIDPRGDGKGMADEVSFRV